LAGFSLIPGNRRRVGDTLTELLCREAAFGFEARQGDPPDQPATLEDQLRWLRDAGFDTIDCHWKWLEIALVGGRRPT